MDDLERARIGMLISRGFALIVLGQRRVIEEQIEDPAQRWVLLRQSLERFVRMKV